MQASRRGLVSRGSGGAAVAGRSEGRVRVACGGQAVVGQCVGGVATSLNAVSECGHLPRHCHAAAHAMYNGMQNAQHAHACSISVCHDACEATFLFFSATPAEEEVAGRLTPARFFSAAAQSSPSTCHLPASCLSFTYLSLCYAQKASIYGEEAWRGTEV